MEEPSENPDRYKAGSIEGLVMPRIFWCVPNPEHPENQKSHSILQKHRHYLILGESNPGMVTAVEGYTGNIMYDIEKNRFILDNRDKLRYTK